MTIPFTVAARALPSAAPPQPPAGVSINCHCRLPTRKRLGHASALFLPAEAFQLTQGSLAFTGRPRRRQSGRARILPSARHASSRHAVGLPDRDRVRREPRRPELASPDARHLRRERPTLGPHGPRAPEIHARPRIAGRLTR